MTLHRDAEQRKRVSALKAEIRLLEQPPKDANRKKLRDERRARVKAIGKPAKGQRQPRVHDRPYLAWVRRQPCAAGQVEGGCEGPIEAAHLRYSDAKQGRVNSGMQCKPDDLWVTPLCRHHHQRDQHAGAERAFWQRLGIEPADLCRNLRAAYEAEMLVQAERRPPNPKDPTL